RERPGRDRRAHAPARRDRGRLHMTDDGRLEITSDTAHGLDVIRLRGELDLTNVDELAAAVEASDAAGIVLDLSLLLFVDSAGVRARASEPARRGRSGRPLLVVAPPASRAPWTSRIAGFADDFVLASVEEAAVRASSTTG